MRKERRHWFGSLWGATNDNWSKKETKDQSVSGNMLSEEGFVKNIVYNVKPIQVIYLEKNLKRVIN